MQFKCYRLREYRMMDYSEFAVFKADHKWVVGILPNADEWLLPYGVTLKAIEQALQLLRISRFTLVARQHILGISGVHNRKELETGVGVFRFSRRLCTKSFEAIARSNAGGSLALKD